MRINFLLFVLFSSFLFCKGQTFFEEYEQGMEYVKADSLDLALNCFNKALRLQPMDRKQARTYGVNFIEYFPNREIGIIYFKKKNYNLAITYLEKSMEQEFSERAKDCLLEIGQVQHETNLSVMDTEPPEIDILSPEMFSQKVFKPVTNQIDKITVAGRAEDPGGIMEVMVNDTKAALSGRGEFTAEIPLNVGQNDIYVRATDMKQNSITRSYLLYRADPGFNDSSYFAEGKYYALIIGISEYIDPQMTDLDGFPTEDAEKLMNILTDKYSFARENIVYLRNPTRSEILKSFDYLVKTITAKDNLLIFFAGHGYYDVETELGYWLPADAEKEYTADWIYNDVLVANIKRIKSKHTLLISDACFSGSIFKTRALEADAPVAFQKKYELRSRKAITSGVLKSVPNKSIFFEYLAESLEKNKDKYLSASQLFKDIEIPVANNSPDTPQYGVIRDVGDEGGDFIFIRK
jgi:tetratricopeptide (TPR) repeat protein